MAVGRLARITVDQYDRMIKEGILKEGAPIELLDGLLVYKDRSTRGEDPMGIGIPHNLAVDLILQAVHQLVPLGCYVRIQGSVSLPRYDEPEPDATIVKGKPRDYSKRLPGPQDIYCIIEVADSSLDFDRTTKLRIYAQSGIHQYVILNLIDLQAEVYEQPVPAEGRYE
jgi:Uma2 family endonuclease